MEQNAGRISFSQYSTIFLIIKFVYKNNFYQNIYDLYSIDLLIKKLYNSLMQKRLEAKLVNGPTVAKEQVPVTVHGAIVQLIHHINKLSEDGVHGWHAAQGRE